MRRDARAPDWPFLAASDRLVEVIQTMWGQSLPSLRRESVLAIWATLALACGIEIALLGWDSRAPIYLGVGAATFLPLLRTLRRTTRDASTAWSPQIAHRYLAEAEAARVATGRFVWCLLAGLNQCTLVGIAATQGLGVNALAVIPLNLAILAYHHLACATPRTPGRDRRSSPSVASA